MKQGWEQVISNKDKSVSWSICISIVDTMKEQKFKKPLDYGKG